MSEAANRRCAKHPLTLSLSRGGERERYGAVLFSLSLRGRGWLANEVSKPGEGAFDESCCSDGWYHR